MTHNLGECGLHVGHVSIKASANLMVLGLQQCLTASLHQQQHVSAIPSNDTALVIDLIDFFAPKCLTAILHQQHKIVTDDC